MTGGRTRTEILDILYKDGGPAEGPPTLLLHGWPDAVSRAVLEEIG